MSDTEGTRVQAQFNFLGIVLRLMTLGGKFLLVIYLAKYLSLTDLGVYGLFVATNLLATYVIGFEFEQYTTREVLRVSPEERPEVVWSQARFNALGILVAFPAFGAVFTLGFLPWSTAPWFFPVLLGTIISNSLHRLLITVSRPLAAYVVSACAHGVWVFAAVGLGAVGPAYRNLHVVLGCWAVAALGTAFGTIIFVRRLGLLVGGPSRGSWQRVREGLRTSWILFLATLSYRVVELADRYFIQHYRGEAAVGTYTLFARVAGVLHEMVVVGFVAVLFPKLVESHQRKDKAGYRESSQRLFRAVLFSTTALLPPFIAGIYLLLWFVNDPRVAAALPVYFVLLAGASVLNLSLSPHYALFAWKCDRLILVSTSSAAVMNILLNAALVPPFGLMGAAVATTLSFSIMGLLKEGMRLRMRVEHAL